MQIHKTITTALVLLATIAPIGLLTEGAWAQEPFVNGIASGDTTLTSTVLWARSDVSRTVRFEVSTDPDFSAIVARETVRVTEDRIPAKVRIGGLVPGGTYYYRARLGAQSSATGTFRTASGIDESPGLRFGASGDWRGELSPYPAITNGPARDLDAFFALGDTIYADFPSPALEFDQAETLKDYRVKHAEVYSERFGLNAWAELRASTSILATIDDHEVTNDFAGGASPATDPRFADDPADFINDTELYENGLQVFQEYNPLANEFYGDTGDPVTAFERKLYRYRTYGSDAAFFVLDARSFRGAPLEGVTDPTDPTQIGLFLFNSFDPNRTMLGAAQLADLKADLQEAQDWGITWKFVLVPEPIQNLGVIAAEDRFEGYAAERTDLLSFIDLNNIENVVFIAADLHGTLVNNLTYQDFPFGPQIPTAAFEIITGSVAFDAPFGPAVVNLAFAAGLITVLQKSIYDGLPRFQQDLFVANLINTAALLPLGYDPLGLEPLAAGGLINASLDPSVPFNGYVKVHTFGWTEFEIASETQILTVTTYGIDPYTAEDVVADPEDILSRTPEVISRFEVVPAGSGMAVSSAPGF